MEFKKIYKNSNTIYILLLVIISVFFVKSQMNNIETQTKEIYQLNSFIGYGTLNDLTKDSNLIVYGSVLNNEISVEKYSDKMDKVYTVSEFKIESIIKGNIEEIENIDIIKILQDGGFYKNTNYVSMGVNLLEKNLNYIMFLNKSEKKLDYYVPINPIQGQIRVLDDKLQMESDEFIKMRSNIFTDQIDKEKFTKKIISLEPEP